ncbi:MAG: hypothetical protein JWM11_6838 [Planctomycetaceae bacterium]|nr:hypothetical protein [Planctomycetaceae bacterium]
MAKVVSISQSQLRTISLDSVGLKAMDHLWDLLTNGNAFLLGLLAWILYRVGLAVARDRPEIQSWASRTGIGVLGWFVLTHLVLHRRPDAADLLTLAIRGLVAAGMTYAIALLILPYIFGVVAVWNSFVRRIQTTVASYNLHRERLKAALKEELEQMARQREWIRTAPERDEAQRLAQEKSDSDQRQKQMASKRREDARFACHVFYDRHRSELHEKFSSKKLRNYFERYLADTLAAEEVETRAEQLKEMLLNIVEANRGPKPRFSNVGEIHDHFKQQQQSVLSSDFSKDVKDTLISDLAREEIRAIRELRKL